MRGEDCPTIDFLNRHLHAITELQEGRTLTSVWWGLVPDVPHIPLMGEQQAGTNDPREKRALKEICGAP